ncbi:hypothetical protein, partial [Streptococcus pneumoniae]
EIQSLLLKLASAVNIIIRRCGRKGLGKVARLAWWLEEATKQKPERWGDSHSGLCGKAMSGGETAEAKALR